MRARIVVFAALIFASFSMDAAWAAKKEGAKAKPKLTPQQAIMKQYDFNRDGKLGRKEQAAALPAIAQMREQRAMRRNARALQGIQ